MSNYKITTIIPEIVRSIFPLHILRTKYKCEIKSAAIKWKLESEIIYCLTFINTRVCSIIISLKQSIHELLDPLIYLYEALSWNDLFKLQMDFLSP